MRGGRAISPGTSRISLQSPGSSIGLRVPRCARACARSSAGWTAGSAFRPSPHYRRRAHEVSETITAAPSRARIGGAGMSPPSRCLRVLMTTDAIGGVWVFSTALARELCRRGDRVTLVTLGPRPQDHQLAAIGDVAGLDLEITDLALEWMDPDGHDFSRALEHLATIEGRLRPDVVHLNGYREACGDWTAPVLVSAHSCVRSWWRACRGGEPSEPRWHRYIANVAAGLDRADAWIAPTSAFRDTVQALYAPRRRGGVILNGIDFAPTTVTKEPFILAAGRLWDEAKNLVALAAIASELDWPVRVAGPLQSVDGAAAHERG